jgi:hypothetical protein
VRKEHAALLLQNVSNSHGVVPYTQGRHLPFLNSTSPTLIPFGSNALSSSSKTLAHWLPELSPNLHLTYGSHIVLIFTPSKTRYSQSLSTTRPSPPQLQQPDSQRRSLPVLRQNVGGRATRRDGRVAMDDVVCCEQITISCDHPHP